MTIKQARETDIVDYLSKLGHEPEKISGNSYWYLSPLRDEKSPSFKVNRKINRWYDFADGRGGNIVDFGTFFHKCSVSDFLQKLDSPTLQVPSLKQKVNNGLLENVETNQIRIHSVFEISSWPLVNYLHSRRIPHEIANQYLKEVRYQIGEKIYYALGFKNDAGGYELRNQHFKGSSSPKDITFINNNAKDVAVFEGFFNFLSHRAMYYKQPGPDQNFLILNSTSFFEKSITKMQEHKQVHLFLDNDKTGQKFTDQALTLDKEKFRDERKLYQKYADLNEWLTHIGQSQKQQAKQKP